MVAIKSTLLACKHRFLDFDLVAFPFFFTHHTIPFRRQFSLSPSRFLIFISASDEEVFVRNPAFMVTAALTHACQMVELLAFYLDVNLPKRINYRYGLSFVCCEEFSIRAT